LKWRICPFATNLHANDGALEAAQVRNEPVVRSPLCGERRLQRRLVLLQRLPFAQQRFHLIHKHAQVTGFLWFAKSTWLGTIHV